MKARVSSDDRVLGSQVVHTLTSALAPVKENCARCGCESTEAPVQMWTCQTCTKGSVVAQFKPAYLPVCTFCSADVWPGALDEFPEVSPPQPAAAADEAGTGGDGPLA